MNGVIAFLILTLCLGVLVFVPLLTPTEIIVLYGVVDVASCAKALGLCGLLSVLAGWYAVQAGGDDGVFLVRLFIFALLLRMLLGVLIFIFNLQDFFGGDAYTYDFFGETQLNIWLGNTVHEFTMERFTARYGTGVSGWGMIYLVASIYGLIGRNMLAVQFVNAIFGAATVPIIYLCTRHIFGNKRAARISAAFVGFFPSLVLWSSQGLKDAPIVFLLAFCILATLKLSEKLSVGYVIGLLFGLMALLSLRFYIFYIMAVAVGAGFFLGTRNLTAQSFVRQFAIIIVVCAGLAYLGVGRLADVQLEKFTRLDEVQRSRRDASNAAESGFAEDADVSTASGALSTIPIGLTYLLFAPFPWQLASLRQSITFPEMMVWWLSFPALVAGIWFAVRYKLREVAVILLFTTILTLAYSIFQGNVGTAYRQRAQLLVFYFIFVAIGYEIFLEKREDRKRQLEAARKAENRKP
jgi:hypothetical protein